MSGLWSLSYVPVSSGVSSAVCALSLMGSIRLFVVKPYGIRVCNIGVCNISITVICRLILVPFNRAGENGKCLLCQCCRDKDSRGGKAACRQSINGSQCFTAD